MTIPRAKRSRLLARHRELLEIESALWAHGLCVAGLDEAGAGPLAGPVVAGCVVLDPEAADLLVGVDDSKALDSDTREELAERIRAHATAVAVREASVDEIDTLNIRAASLLAMKRAIDAVRAALAVDHVLVDARVIPNCEIPQSCIIRGDGRSLSIAAASILAKVSRDEAMVAAGRRFPEYGFEQHKGYGTRDHLSALRAHGVTPLHRRSFAPVRNLARQMGLFE